MVQTARSVQTRKRAHTNENTAVLSCNQTSTAAMAAPKIIMCFVDDGLVFGSVIMKKENSQNAPPEICAHRVMSVGMWVMCARSSAPRQYTAQNDTTRANFLALHMMMTPRPKTRATGCQLLPHWYEGETAACPCESSSISTSARFVGL